MTIGWLTVSIFYGGLKRSGGRMRNRIEHYLRVLIEEEDPAGAPWVNLRGILQQQGNLSEPDIESLRKRVFKIKLRGAKAQAEVTEILDDICARMEIASHS